MKTILILMFPVLSFGQGVHTFTPQMKSEMMEKVRAAAQHGWEGYKKYAWGADDLKPLTKEPRVWYKKSMLMTPVDAFDTFVLLGLKQEAQEAKQLILSELNFDSDQEVQVFEITIRLLGGLLAAYESEGDKKFLTLAVDLGNRLMPCFGTATGMPYRYVNLRSGKTRDSASNPAEIGTLMLEFGKLSAVTHDQKYYNAAKKAILAVYNRRSKIGLVGEIIDVNTGKWISTQSHISGYIDSYYEYLFKSWKLFGDADFKTAWDHSAAAIRKYIIAKQPEGWFCRHVDMNSGIESQPLYGALDAFIAGLMAYSGDVTTGIQMQKANYYMWTRYNMEPEEFNYKTGKVNDSSYSLRPENLESCFYLYRKTRNPEYLWMGKRMVDDILTHCYTESGFASLKSITTFEKRNSMESFLFGETFKYAFLIFAPDNKLNLEKVVLTTEAHAFSRNTSTK
ncbi:MAG: glycoside hydrolase family 47 protein [Ginsengibacter sp.]